MEKRHHLRSKNYFPTYAVVHCNYLQKGYLNRKDTEDMRVHTRVACEKGNGVVTCTKELCRLAFKKFECDKRMIMKSETYPVEALDIEPVTDAFHSLSTRKAVYLNRSNR